MRRLRTAEALMRKALLADVLNYLEFVKVWQQFLEQRFHMPGAINI